MDDPDAEPMQIDILEDALLRDDDEDEDNEVNQNEGPIIMGHGGQVMNLNIYGGAGAANANGNVEDGELPGVVAALLGAPGGGGQIQGQGQGQQQQDADFQVENPTLVSRKLKIKQLLV